MKIITFNVQHCENYLTKKIDFDAFASAIKQLTPDVIGLNEVRNKGEREDYEAQAQILSSLTGMPYFYFAKAIDVRGNNPYGNAILSKIPFKSVETVAIPDPTENNEGGYYETRCVLKATLENGLTVLITHFGLNPSEQTNAVKTVLDNLTENCVLMGDFNVLPDNPVLDPIYECMQDVENRSADKKSFPSDAPNIKIDYIFTTKNIKALSSEVVNLVLSDHRPHLIEIQD